MPLLQAIDYKGNKIPGKIRFHSDTETSKIFSMKRPLWIMADPGKQKDPSERVAGKNTFPELKSEKTKELISAVRDKSNGVDVTNKKP